MTKVTTIMPIYNMAGYIEETITNWEKQTLADKQLVCINDCSEDNTEGILNELVKRFDNIKVISLKNNLGAGPARNKGIFEADGIYISFLDADDRLIDDTALEKMYSAAESDDCDVCGAFVSEQLDERIIPYSRFRNLSIDYCEYVDVSYEEFQDDYYYQGFIYKKNYLIKNGFEFPNLRRNQDPPFFVKTMFYANRIRIINTEYYLHLIGHKVVTHNTRSICDSFKGFLMDIEFADKNALEDLLEKSFFRINRTFLYLWKGILDKECPEFWNLVLQAENIAVKHGLHVDVLGYLPFLHKRNDCYDEYMTEVKLRNLFSNNDRIILYGAGTNGKKIYSNVIRNNRFKIVKWIDKNKVGDLIEDICISDIRKVDDVEFDYVLISVGNRRISEEIKSELKKRNITEKLIVEWVNV